MTTDQIIQTKAALNALHKVGRLQEKTLLTHVEIEQCKPLTTTAGTLLVRSLLDNKWVGSYDDPVTEVTYYVITPEGRNALATM